MLVYVGKVPLFDPFLYWELRGVCTGPLCSVPDLKIQKQLTAIDKNAYRLVNF
jgi:hypothetical protein